MYMYVQNIIRSHGMPPRDNMEKSWTYKKLYNSMKESRAMVYLVIIILFSNSIANYDMKSVAETMQVW